MKLIKSSYKNLENRVERAMARLAQIAWADANFGHANALVKLARLKGLKSPNLHEYEAAVNGAYSSHDGRAAAFTPYECPECGQVYLGQENALNCCAREEVWAEANEETIGDPEIEELSRVTCEEFYDRDTRESDARIEEWETRQKGLAELVG